MANQLFRSLRVWISKVIWVKDRGVKHIIIYSIFNKKNIVSLFIDLLFFVLVILNCIVLNRYNFFLFEFMIFFN